MSIQIENIEERRREAGIDDVELREQIRRLAVGDCVALTLLNLTRVYSEQTLLVRITRIRGLALRGKVIGKRVPAGSPRPRPGTQLAFTTGHIHSIPLSGRSSPRPGSSSNGRKGRSMPPKSTRPTRPPLPTAPTLPRAAAETPATVADRLRRIALLGERVAEYVAFMAQVASQSGTSAEVQERSVAAFLERLTILESQLAQIHEELRLG